MLGTKIEKKSSLVSKIKMNNFTGRKNMFKQISEATFTHMHKR